MPGVHPQVAAPLRGLLDQAAVLLPEAAHVRGRLAAVLPDLLVDVVDRGHDERPAVPDHAVGVEGLSRLEHDGGGEGAEPEAVRQRPPRLRRAPGRVGAGAGHEVAVGRDGDDEPVAVAAGELLGAVVEARYVDGDARLDLHEPEVEHVEADGPGLAARARRRVVHLLAVEEPAQHPHVLLELAVADGALAHQALRGVAGPDPEKHPPRREAVDGGDAVGGDGGGAGARDADPGPDPDRPGLAGGEGHPSVAVGPDHLAVRDPQVGVAEVLGLAREADVVDLRDGADAEVHVLPLLASVVVCGRARSAAAGCRPPAGHPPPACPSGIGTVFPAARWAAPSVRRAPGRRGCRPRSDTAIVKQIS